ncbi:hypothetical protein EDD11_009348 [Mortierella claussenii]|nr:hypothetical protein EDD11_009348 [Mortierella claussenii]
MPSLGFALVGNDWKFQNAPSDGLSDVTFPFNIANAPHKSGFYFAQQFNFNGVAQLGYTGLQPRPDANGNSVVHADFSSFQDGTTSNHPNCHSGADGGPGVSCAVDINGDYSHTYNLVVENIGGTTWRGTLVDIVAGSSTVVGEWTLPSGAGKIVNGQVGFVEYYIWNSQPTNTCASLPFTEATFYDPTSKTSGASGGQITSVYEHGDCVGKAGYRATKVSGGYDIEVGF